MRRLLLPLLITASLAAACGEEVEDRAVERDTPAITSPGTTIPYENGGGDGSGADGSEKANKRGGIAAGPDNPGPQDSPEADEAVEPQQGASDE
jgi:hypothetical protein